MSVAESGLLDIKKDPVCPMQSKKTNPPLNYNPQYMAK